jgi:hypothetical protein
MYVSIFLVLFESPLGSLAPVVSLYNQLLPTSSSKDGQSYRAEARYASTTDIAKIGADLTTTFIRT